MAKIPTYSSIDIEEDKYVYRPDVDTFALIDALDLSLGEMRGKVFTSIEIGCGSGVVSTYLSSKLPVISTCTDINPFALSLTKKVSLENEAYCVLPIRTDLCSGFSPQFAFDVVIFNPPYVPSEKEEVWQPGGKLHPEKIDTSPAFSFDFTKSVSFSREKIIEDSDEWVQTGNILTCALSGGDNGREVIDRFLHDHMDIIASSKYFFLVCVSENNPKELMKLIELGTKREVDQWESGKTPKPCQKRCEVVIRRDCQSEGLYIIRATNV
ncbi:hypothetical protein ADUPG1_008809 [Aduncisulcus paluster]|uniref:Methyltransferase small domain-containing protein n=1 Tax=Aduncisulcus paluster TaxID=2918883 RepID=A0ABQ5KUL8_9EUKA|nr:hypothetical protein ADUPG1_008809 [Aduncisulcus paluster]